MLYSKNRETERLRPRRNIASAVSFDRLQFLLPPSKPVCSWGCESRGNDDDFYRLLYTSGFVPYMNTARMRYSRPTETKLFTVVMEVKLYGCWRRNKKFRVGPFEVSRKADKSLYLILWRCYRRVSISSS